MDKILTNIEYGWCNFKLGEYEGKPSYIRMLPLDILEAYEEYRKYNHCIVEFDEELRQFCLVIWNESVMILDNRDNKYNSFYIDINAEDVLNELVDEIIIDIPLWSEWMSLSSSDEDIEKYKEILNKKAEKINRYKDIYL